MTALDQINWTSEYSGAGVTVGSMDGWPAVDHPDLRGRVSILPYASNASFAPMSNYADHSTGVTGIVAMVAKDARQLVSPIWTARDQFVAYDAYRNSTLNAIYAKFAAAGVVCVNRELNWGRRPWVGGSAIWGWANPYAPWSYVTDLDLVARYPEFVHVQALGNDGVPIGSQPTTLPASTFDHLILVGNVDSANKIWTGMYPSNTPQSRGMYAPGDAVIKPEKYLKNFTVVAPGVGLTLPASPSGYNYGWAGTSFATAFVEGLVALMYEKAARLGQTLAPSRCARIIRDTCKPLGPAEIYGHGIIDVKAALEALHA